MYPGPFGRVSATALVILIAMCAARTGVNAQLATSEHPGQYTQADIDAGSRLYTSQCTQCHGPNGDMITGIDLRRGQFRRVNSDEDLARVIMNGVPGTAMPAFSLQPPE